MVFHFLTSYLVQKWMNKLDKNKQYDIFKIDIQDWLKREHV